jgi:hypothetical protein
MEHFNSILFHKSRPANKQPTNQSIKSLKLTFTFLEVMIVFV